MKAINPKDLIARTAKDLRHLKEEINAETELAKAPESQVKFTKTQTDLWELDLSKIRLGIDSDPTKRLDLDEADSQDSEEDETNTTLDFALNLTKAKDID